MSADVKSQALQRSTAAHYDTYPFDFLTPEDEDSIADMQSRPFLRFIREHGKAGMKVAEIGCGPGRGTMYLVQAGLDVTALDLSAASLALARRRAPTARFIEGSNLDLPFADARFDLVVSDGVIHHTPDARRSFTENVRILRRGGCLYLGVYNRRRYYYYLYTYLGQPMRRVESSRIGRIFIYATLFPLYYVAHLIKSRGRRTIRGARNLFYDYFITPRASFHTREEVASWGRDSGLELLDYDPSVGNVHVFVFRKPLDRRGGSGP